MVLSSKLIRGYSHLKMQMVGFDENGYNPHVEELDSSGTARSVSDSMSEDAWGFKEFNQITTALKGMFDKKPELVERMILEIGRFLKSEQQTDDTFMVDGKSQSSRQMIALRYFKKNMESYPKWTGLLVNPDVVDFLEQYGIMKESGIGLTLEEAFGINLSIRIVTASTPHIKSARFWGKIYGTIKDYYVLECVLTPAEAIDRNQKLNKIYAEKEKNSNLQRRFSYINVKTPSQMMNQWEKKLNIVNPSTYEVHELDQEVLKLKGKSKIGKVEKPPRPKIEINPKIETRYEPVGTGLNRKLYLVSNVPYGDWMELPYVTPEQIILSKQIKRHFTGIINQEIETIPPFPGNEKCYLRAQIARISAGTQISPIGFYHFGMEEEDLGEIGDSSGACSLNPEYNPVQVSDLGGERGNDFWVHHAEYILDEGRVTHWSPLMNRGEEDEAFGEDFGMEDDFVDNYPKLLTPVSCDTAVFPIPPWTVQTKENYFVNTATVVARSNLWPGAFAYTQDLHADTVYIGWGHKYGSGGVPDYIPPDPSLEYPSGPDVMEYADPTVEYTREWIKDHTPPLPPPFTGLMGEGGEGEPGLLAEGE